MINLKGSVYLVLALLPCGFAQTQPASVKRVPVRPTASVAGKDLFRQYCASCHGGDAKGNGPAAAALKAPPTDLTRMSLNNKGRFPEDRVLRILQGQQPIAAHGSSDMPVWGTVLGNMSSNLTLKQTRVHSLLSYLEALQEK